MIMIEDISPTEEQQAFAETAKRCFAECGELQPSQIAVKLGEFGLLGIMASEDAGGLALGAAETWHVVRAAGAALLRYPVAEAIVAARYAGGGLVNGDRIATVCWSGDFEVRPDGAGWRISGVAPRVAHARSADSIVFGTTAGLFSIDLSSSGVRIVPANELDAERDFGDVLFTDAPATIIGEPVEVERFDRLGALLRAADMIGAAESAFASTCVHTGTRRQFGKPLSALQVVSTDIARDHYRLECALTSLDYAALAWDGQQDDAADACAIVAAYTADQLPGVAEYAIQLHGAMGFTWEMPLHRWLRRIRTMAAVVPPRVERTAIADRLMRRWTEAA